MMQNEVIMKLLCIVNIMLLSSSIIYAMENQSDDTLSKLEAGEMQIQPDPEPSSIANTKKRAFWDCINYLHKRPNRYIANKPKKLTMRLSGETIKSRIEKATLRLLILDMDAIREIDARSHNAIRAWLEYYCKDGSFTHEKRTRVNGNVYFMPYYTENIIETAAEEFKNKNIFLISAAVFNYIPHAFYTPESVQQYIAHFDTENSEFHPDDFTRTAIPAYLKELEESEDPEVIKRMAYQKARELLGL